MNNNLQFLGEHGELSITVLVLERAGGWITETSIRLGDETVGEIVKDEFLRASRDLAGQAGMKAAKGRIDELNKAKND